MSHRVCLIIAWILAAVAVPCSAGAATPRPNVLFIIADDMSTALGCYGDPRAKTPNIDRLAARGMRFDRAYCQFPLCGPSRNSMLTGLHPNSNGIHANAQIFRQTIPEHVSLPQAFRHAGYFVGRVGKLFHYNVPNSIGTAGHDDPASWELQLNPAGVDHLRDESNIFSITPGQYAGTLSWYASPAPDEQHSDGMVAENATWVLERCAKQKDRPFFLGVGFFRPHTPYVSPEKYFAMYPPAEMPIVQNVKGDQADLPIAALGSYKPEQDKLTDDLRRQCVQAYYASVSFVDTQVGVVLDALERLGLADNTIIVLTSDHGYHLGEHGLWQKMSLFEESTRVPLLIAAPGVAGSGSASKSFAGLIDLYPTLAELCEVEAPKNLQGQSLVPTLRDPTRKVQDAMVCQVQRGGGSMGRAGSVPDIGSAGPKFFGYSLRTDRWRYTEWDEGRNGRELYDHVADPKELTNLAASAEHTATIDQLSRRLHEAVKATFPPSGQTPELKPGVWLPELVGAGDD